MPTSGTPSFPPPFPPKRKSQAPGEKPSNAQSQPSQDQKKLEDRPLTQPPRPAELAPKKRMVSKTAVCGYCTGALLLLLGVGNLFASGDNTLGDLVKQARQSMAVAYFAAGVNTLMIATICQHTKRQQENPVYEELSMFLWGEDQEKDI